MYNNYLKEYFNIFFFWIINLFTKIFNHNYQYIDEKIIIFKNKKKDYIENENYDDKIQPIYPINLMTNNKIYMRKNIYKHQNKLYSYFDDLECSDDSDYDNDYDNDTNTKLNEKIYKKIKKD